MPDGEATHSPRSGVLSKLVAGLLVAAAVLAMVEGGMRLLLGPPPPPVTVFQTREVGESYLSIEDGMVAPNYQLYAPIDAFEQTPTGRRAAVLGGSSVHVGGGKSAVDAEFSELLADRLGVAVHNLGAPALDSHDLVSIVEELSVVPLDLLVIYAGHNDLGNTMFQQRYGDMVGRFSVRVLPVLEHLQMFSQLRRILTPSVGTAHPDKPGLIRKDRTRRPTTLQRETATRFFTANLHRMVWLCQRRGLPLILVVPASDLLAAPARDHCKLNEPCAKGLWRRGAKVSNDNPEDGLLLLQQARDIDPVSIRASSEIEAAVRSFDGEDGVVVIDAAADLPRAEVALVPHRRLFEDAIHFSSDGHIAIADLITPAAASVLSAAP